MRTHLVRRLGAVAALIAGSLVATVVPNPAARPPRLPADGPPRPPPPSTPACRCSPPAPSAPPTSSSPDGADVLIGYAAHCAGTGAATETDGCLAGSLPLGTPVEIDGASQPGTLVYSSWLAMQAAGETDADACAYNDFALVRIAPADVGKVNPSIPHWGGPTGLNTTGNPALSRALQLRQLEPAARPHPAVAQDRREPRHHRRRLDATRPTPSRPGIPGDSGSALLDAQRPRRRRAVHRGHRARSPAATTSATSAGRWPTPRATARAA